MALVALLAGCAGSLDDPDRFKVDAGADAAAGAGGFGSDDGGAGGASTSGSGGSGGTSSGGAGGAGGAGTGGATPNDAGTD